MTTINLTSLHGTALSAPVSDTIKINRDTVNIVRKLGRLYAIVDGYSILEMPDTTDMIEFNKLIINEL